VTRTRRTAVSLATLVALTFAPTTALAAQHKSPAVKSRTTTTTTTTTTSTSLPGTTGPVRVATLASPDRTVVSDDLGTVAVFTSGARTVTVRGSARTFAEPSTTTATVSSSTWVRLLPTAFAGSIDWAWLEARLTDTSPDVLDLAFQYGPGAPALVDAGGVQFAGDASYGPLQADGTRQEGSDFNDYLGLTWTYDGSTDRPEADQFRSLDCSGYVRMVFGYRSGIPITLRPDGARLPRRAVQMLDSAPGVVTIANTGVRPTDLSTLLPGDLLFWDASTDDGTAVDHVGLYLGKDSAGAPRFVSSRKTADGPTMGDSGGRSTLSGTGLYAKSFRAARRV
jgi:cell wall-associated NlpC family hydrolase